jgi:hypothetical protein
MTAATCALCQQNRKCLAKEIDEMEYDICPKCWREFAQKLQGRGRIIERHNLVTLSPLDMRWLKPDEKPFPGRPPKVWLSERPN